MTYLAMFWDGSVPRDFAKKSNYAIWGEKKNRLSIFAREKSLKLQFFPKLSLERQKNPYLKKAKKYFKVDVRKFLW